MIPVVASKMHLNLKRLLSEIEEMFENVHECKEVFQSGLSTLHKITFGIPLSSLNCKKNGQQ